MNIDEYLQAMKQEIDESVKDDEKIQEFLVWLHEKTASLASPYQESAVRAFYCVVVSKKWGRDVNREICRILDSEFDEGLSQVREVASKLMELDIRDDFIYFYDKSIYRQTFQLLYRVKRMSALDIVIDRDLAIFCDQDFDEHEIYLDRTTALLVGLFSPWLREQYKAAGFSYQKSDEDFLQIIINLTKRHSDRFSINNSRSFKKDLSLVLSEYRNLKLDWQFSDEQRQLLDQYYSANKFLVDCLQEYNPSPEVQKGIKDTLLLPIVEIERRRLNVAKQLTMNESSESNSILEVQETQEILLPVIEVQSHEIDATDTKLIGSTQESSSPGTQEIQEVVLPIIEAEESENSKQESYPTSTKTNVYRTIFLCLLLILALSIASAIFLKKYV
ncbi:hypothetical protein AB3R30_25955 [Leptolyngbyaceae cyanobacterium UHCC 1019]